MIIITYNILFEDQNINKMCHKNSERKFFVISPSKREREKIKVG